MNLQNLKNKLQRKKGQLQQIEKSISESQKKIETTKAILESSEQAQVIIQKVAKQTQEELEYSISELVSLAMSGVWKNPYGFELDFVVRRNKTEADTWFVRNEERVEPLSASGGGALDVASFALRIALLNLRRPKPRPTVFLDEPFKSLKPREKQIRASQILKEISDKLGLQIIMISHYEKAEEIPEGSSDRIFESSIRKGITTIGEA